MRPLYDMIRAQCKPCCYVGKSVENYTGAKWATSVGKEGGRAENPRGDIDIGVAELFGISATGLVSIRIKEIKARYPTLATRIIKRNTR